MYHKCRVFCERIIGMKEGTNNNKKRKNSKICVICNSIMDREGAYCEKCLRKICDKEYQM